MPAPLRLLFMNWRDTRNPEGGGSEVFLESVARGLALAGNEVTIFCAAHDNAPAEEVVDGVHFVRAGSKLGVYVEGFKRLRRGDFGPLDGVVDVQNGIPFFASRATDVPVAMMVYHVHREQWPVVYGPVRWRIGWFIESRLSPWVHRHRQYLTISERTRAELTTLGVDHERIHVVRAGSSAPETEGPGPDGCPRILVLGRLVPHKRVEQVLRAAGPLRQKHPGLTVSVVGDGWWSEELRAAATEAGVDDIVEFAGFVDERRKHEELSRAWVLALPSLKEGWGLVVTEAAMHGVPTVAYRSAGGVVESISDGVTGVLVDGDEADYAAALDQLLSQHEVRTQLGKAARERAEELSWQDTADAFAVALATAFGLASVQMEPTEEPVRLGHEITDPAQQSADPA